MANTAAAAALAISTKRDANVRQKTSSIFPRVLQQEQQPRGSGGLDDEPYLLVFFFLPFLLVFFFLPFLLVFFFLPFLLVFFFLFFFFGLFHLLFLLFQLVLEQVLDDAVCHYCRRRRRGIGRRRDRGRGRH